MTYVGDRPLYPFRDRSSLLLERRVHLLLPLALIIPDKVPAVCDSMNSIRSLTLVATLYICTASSVLMYSGIN